MNGDHPWRPGLTTGPTKTWRRISKGHCLLVSQNAGRGPFHLWTVYLRGNPTVDRPDASGITQGHTEAMAAADQALEQLLKPPNTP